MELLEMRAPQGCMWIAGAHDDLRWPLKRAASAKADVPFAMDSQFISMLSAFRPTGGIARHHELEAADASRLPLGRQALTASLRDRAVFAFEWRQVAWIPMFQFDPAQRTPRSDVQQVVGELRPVFDDWEIAIWFAQANASLDGRTPVSCVDRDWEALRQAARTDRFAATG